MSRITVTDKGRLLQSELIGDVTEGSFTSRQHEQVSYITMIDNGFSLKKSRTKSTQNRGELFPKHLTINEEIKKNLEFLEDKPGKEKTPLQLDLYNNPYLISKLTKMQQNALKGSPTTRRSEPGSITLPPILSARGSHVSKFAASRDPYGSNSPRDSMNIQDEIDQSSVLTMSYPKKIHYESSINRLVEQHLLNEKKMLKTAKKVLENYDKRVHAIESENHKPPVLLETLQKKNPEAVEILMRNTKQEFRKKARLDNYWQQKYQPYQSRFQDYQTKKVANRMEEIRQKKMAFIQNPQE